MEFKRVKVLPWFFNFFKTVEPVMDAHALRVVSVFPSRARFFGDNKTTK